MHKAQVYSEKGSNKKLHLQLRGEGGVGFWCVTGHNQGVAWISSVYETLKRKQKNASKVA